MKKHLLSALDEQAKLHALHPLTGDNQGENGESRARNRGPGQDALTASLELLRTWQVLHFFFLEIRVTLWAVTFLVSFSNIALPEQGGEGFVQTYCPSLNISL